MSQFSELDSLDLVKIYESLNKKSSDKNPKKKDEKREKHKEPKDKEQLRKERKERERRKEEHRDKLKRKLEMGDNGDVSKESMIKRIAGSVNFTRGNTTTRTINSGGRIRHLLLLCSEFISE